MKEQLHSTAGDEIKTKQTILLIEDENSVRMMTEKVLRRYGFGVLCARDGEEGLNIYRSGDGIDLVLLDLSLPKITGGKVFASILEMNPEANVIITSGYSAGEIGGDLMRRASGFLAKPFKIHDLIDIVKSVSVQM
ncbi:MAG: response regulator [Candidatus Latescibacteria bacterium]|nr:response regulator [Candidatus Latescibacterota bacterium]